MMYKLADRVELVLDVPESDKKVAERAIATLKSTTTMLKHSEDILDKIYDPFKNNPQSSQDSIKDAAAAIFRYKENIKKTFSEIKYMILKSIGLFIYFDSGTKAHEMNESLKELSEKLDFAVVALLDSMDDTDDVDFQSAIVKSIDDVKAASKDVVELINDRIVDYLENNVLNTNWFNKSKSDIEMEMLERTPNLIKLYEEGRGIAEKDLRGNVVQMEIQPTPIQKMQRDEINNSNNGGV
jgi:regulator of replication initiation timing